MHSSSLSSSLVQEDATAVYADAQRLITSGLNPQQSQARSAASTIVQFHFCDKCMYCQHFLNLVRRICTHPDCHALYYKAHCSANQMYCMMGSGTRGLSFWQRRARFSAARYSEYDCYYTPIVRSFAKVNSKSGSLTIKIILTPRHLYNHFFC